jgi:hypothetical protein
VHYIIAAKALPKYFPGSKAEISVFPSDYRFRSESGHKFFCATAAEDWRY